MHGIEHLPALGRAAQASRIAAAAIRWAAACATGFAALLLLSVGLASFERAGPLETAETSASAYLDFDLAVLRTLSGRSLAGEDGLAAIWARRPAWRVPPAASGAARLAPLGDAWAAVTSDRSRFRTAARGVGDALPYLLLGLSLALCAAAAAGAAGALRKRAWIPALAALFIAPAWAMLEPGAFYDRTRSFGTGLGAILFVAAFAAALPGAALQALFAPARAAAHLSALAGRPALTTAARLAAIEAVPWLLPVVPALSAAALFVCAKADQDPAARGTASGFGGLVRAAMSEVGAGDRLASCALAAGGLALLSFLGHRFVVEVRAALSADGGGP